jgi:pSer/pThr/pTyr-binding forkhead associated (FHA) protein
MRLTLEITDGQERGRRLWLRGGQSTSVGRTEKAEFVVVDGQMSSLHFSLTSQADQFLIRDCDSSNGTFVNGTKVTQVALCDGDSIRAGQTAFSVHVEARGSLAATSLPPAAQLEPSRTAPAAQVAQGRDTALPMPRKTASPQPPMPEQNESPPSEPDEGVLVSHNKTPFPMGMLLWQDEHGRAQLTVLVKITLRFGQNKVAVAENQLPVFEADEPYADEPASSLKFESDLVPFKPRADIVLVGQAHSPQSRPVKELDVRLRVGEKQQRIRVIGNRKWWFPTAFALVPKITEPEPFVTMPLVYERAFGGIDPAAALYCHENLAGTGFVGKLCKESLHDTALPNLEDPSNLVHAWNSRPKPVGFGFYGRGWKPRLGYAGTYDEKYRKERAPLPPLDFSHLIHNGAHPDWQVEGYLRGDEQVELENLSPEGTIQFQLPGLRPRIELVRRKSTLSSRVRREEARAALDTLVLIPDQKLLYGVFRAVCPLASLEDPDITQITITM